MKFYGQGGAKPKFYQRETMLAWLQSLEGKEICMDISEVKVKRSLDQNSGLHLLFTVFAKMLSDETGQYFSMEEIKGLCAAELLRATKEIKGEWMEYIRSSSSLTKPECADYITQIYAYAANKFGITLPELIS